MAKTDVVDWDVYVSGRFPGLQSDEVSAHLHGLGARVTESKSVARAILTATPDDPKNLAFAAKGKVILTLEDLTPPLEGWVERLKAAEASFEKELARKTMLHHFAVGQPADPTLMAKVEAAIGFPAPDDLRALMLQFDGLSLVGAERVPHATLTLPQEVLPYAALVDGGHPLWAAIAPGEPVTTIAIPRWQDVFLRPVEARLSGPGSYGPKDKLKIGALKVSGSDLHARLFPFDLFHPFHGAALYADPVAKDLKVLYASDHWASLTDYHPVSLSVYMESLAGMVWHKSAHWVQRIIAPTSKTAWPTYIRKIHGAAYVFLETRS